MSFPLSICNQLKSMDFSYDDVRFNELLHILHNNEEAVCIYT